MITKPPPDRRRTKDYGYGNTFYLCSPFGGAERNYTARQHPIRTALEFKYITIKKGGNRKEEEAEKTPIRHMVINVGTFVSYREQAVAQG